MFFDFDSIAYVYIWITVDSIICLCFCRCGATSSRGGVGCRAGPLGAGETTVGGATGGRETLKG
jgi:hypothetical protein